MSPRQDLTRWNRGGLSRFRYVDGNAVHYFDALLRNIELEFPPSEPETPAESAADARDRRQAQYAENPKDWATEITRAFARASHILMEYVDAYANEGFLPTATQWEHVRRLVAMLDYRAAPPSSASTYLALLAQDAEGILRRGFAVQHVPQGDAPIVFETLEDTDVVPELNVLRPRNALVNPTRLHGDLLALEGEIKNIKVGEPLVLEDGSKFASYLVTGTRATSTEDGEPITEVRVHPALDGRFTAGETTIHLDPADRMGLIGPESSGISESTTLHLTGIPRGLQAGEIVFVTNGGTGYYRRVKAVRGRRLVFFDSLGAMSLRGAMVGRTSAIRAIPGTGTATYGHYTWVEGDHTGLRGKRVAGDRFGRLPEYLVVGAEYPSVAPAPSNIGGCTRLQVELVPELRGSGVLVGERPEKLVLPPGGRGDWDADMVLQTIDDVVPRAITVEAPKEAGPGDFAVLARGGQTAHCRIQSLTPDRGERLAELVAVGEWGGYGGGPWFFADSDVYSHFRKDARVQSWQVNGTPISGAVFPLATISEHFVPGRRVIVLREAEQSIAVPTRVVRGRAQGVELVDALPAGATLGNLYLFGNVVPAGHGETRDEEILGDGDATASNQSFELTVTEPAFVADPGYPAGVRADVTVTVEGRSWTQVPTLVNSSPTDHHFEARITEDGTVSVLFGDGQRGRRLPTGTNNVRATFRQGTGLRGNLPPGSIEKAVRPSPLLASVRQPVAASGGNEMETADSLRSNAPAALLSLDRAVSLPDYSHLAARNSMVWQARAFRPLPSVGRSETVTVVVVPAGGGDLGSLKASLEAFLTAHGQPGIEIIVRRYRAVDLRVRAEIAVDSTAYDPDMVVARVKASFSEAFSLRNRRLGAPLYRSDLLTVAENVPGVEYARCDISDTTIPPPPHHPRYVARGRDGSIRAIRPFEDQVISIPKDPTAIEVSHSEVVT